MQKVITIAAVILSAAACKPAALDPDATFIIEGRLENSDGSGAAGVTARIFKVDFWDANVFIQDSFLHVPLIHTQPGLQGAPYTVTSDAGGNFRIELMGYQVNSSNGGAAYLTVVHQRDGDENEFMATASDWFYFEAENPIHDVGTLRLWDAAGATGTDSGASVTFNWTAEAAPAGFDHDGNRPYFLFAYDNLSPTLQWAEHTFSTSASAPRAAFEDISNGPEWFLVSYTEETVGSRRYMMRTSLKRVGPWADDFVDRSNWIFPALSDDGGVGFTTLGDVDIDSAHYFSFQTIAINADLQFATPVQAVLVFGLGVANLHNATVELEGFDGGGWSTLKTYLGDRDFENWVYLGWTGTGTFQELRVSVRNNGAGAAPYITFIDEIVAVTE